MTQKHSTPIRGLAAAGMRVDFQGRFGRLFPNLPAAQFGSQDESEARLGKLARAMVSSLDKPKDGPDDEESGIPSLYTYFGQFVDHDLTFDPDASFQKQKDVDAKVDFRTPAFDLDNIYGRGPDDQPYMYASDGLSFELGDPLTLGKPPGAHDLQRNAAGRALIGDPRNDENAIVSQLQGLFLRFHNRVVREAGAKPKFEDVQKIVRTHYQYLVVNDFLSRIVHATVLKDLKTDGRYDRKRLKLFKDLQNPFMPIEFSVAAYRLGHSMVRPGYRLNDATLVPIFPEPDAGLPEGLTGFRRMISDWGIDWARFIDVELRPYGSMADADAGKENFENFRRLQFAYRIDTALVNPLSKLPPTVAGAPPSLALHNLLRAYKFGLPSGQSVAKAIGATPLKDGEILIGQGVDEPDTKLKGIVEATGVEQFADNCPLWTYILAEAMRHKARGPIPVKGDTIISTPQLGPVGGRIVAEVFLGLMFADPYSYLSERPDWVPTAGANYRLKDFVMFALG
jgi:hypothetical protein